MTEPLAPQPVDGFAPVFPAATTAPPFHPVRTRPGWRPVVFGVVTPILFFFVALGVYGPELDRPDIIVFDEAHYLRAARNFTTGDWMDPGWEDGRAFNWEHPPLAKYQIAVAIALGGEEPGIYRIPALLNGALGVAGLSVLGRRMTKSDLGGVLAPTFLLLDPMWFVNSRVVLLDIFAAAPLVWAFAFAFGHRAWEPYVAAVMAGVAGACKYSADFLLPALFLILVWRLSRRMGFGLATFVGALLAFGVPAVILVASHAPMLAVWSADGGIGHAAVRFVEVFEDSLDWGATGAIDHPDKTHPLVWLAMARPTWYYAWWGAGIQRDQEAAVIYALGNPVMWWAGPFLAVVFLIAPAWRILRSLRETARARGDLLVAISGPDRGRIARLGAPLGIFLVGYAVFFLLARVTFLYYMTLLVPYLALISAAVVVELVRRPDTELPNPTPNVRAKNQIPPDSAAQVDFGNRVIRALVALERWAIAGWHWFLWFWRGPWPGRILAIAFVAAAALLAVVLAPLYTGDQTTKAIIDDTWRLIPWMERSLPYSPMT